MEAASGARGWFRDGITVTASFPQLRTAKAAQNGAADEPSEPLSRGSALQVIKQQRSEIEQLRGAWLHACGGAQVRGLLCG
jgi:hypothetical protein